MFDKCCVLILKAEAINVIKTVQIRIFLDKRCVKHIREMTADIEMKTEILDYQRLSGMYSLYVQFDRRK